MATNIFHTYFFNAEYIAKAKMRFVGPAAAYFMKGFVFVVGILSTFLWEWELTLTRLGLLYSAAALIAAVVINVMVRDEIPRRLRFDKFWVGKLYGYGRFTLLTNVGAVFQRNIDMWMLSFYLNTSAVAIYNAAIRVANLFELPLMAIASILFPRAVQKAEMEGKSAFKPLYEKSLAIILIITTPFVIGVIVFADEVILLLAGSGYADSADVLRVTMLYGLVLPFHKQMGLLFDAIGKARINTIFTLRNAILNAVLNAIAIPIFGVMGAAFATLSTFVLMLIYNTWYINRHYGVQLKSILGYVFSYGLMIIKGDLKKLN